MKNLKKILSVIITAIMLFGSVCAVQAENDIKVLLDGTELSFDVPPQIIDDRTLVPLRVIFEALGAEVVWDGETQTVTATKADKTITMTIGMYAMSVNTEAITLDVPPMIIDDRTLVPVRAVAEGFDAKVTWDGNNRIVTINTDGSEPVPAEPEPTLTPAADPEPTVAPEPAEEYYIEYDSSRELLESYMKDFTITNIEKTDDGKFNITYTLRTFYEGRGVVMVSFNCLNKDGKVVDSWVGSFSGPDYAWAPQESSVTISGDTAKIELVIK